MFLSPLSAWYDAGGQEQMGTRVLALLRSSLGEAGLRGIDLMLAHTAAAALHRLLRRLGALVEGGRAEAAGQAEKELWQAAPGGGLGPAAFATAAGKVAPKGGQWAEAAQLAGEAGQAQLLRHLIAHHLRPAAQIEAGVVAGAMEALGGEVLLDLRRPSEAGGGAEAPGAHLLAALARQQAGLGQQSPTCQLLAAAPPPPPLLPFLLALLTISQLPRYVMDTHLNALTCRSRKATLDCAPLAIGIGSLLQQTSPAVWPAYLQYLHLYSECHVAAAAQQAAAGGQLGLDSQSELAKVSAWMQLLAAFLPLRRPPDTCPAAVVATLL